MYKCNIESLEPKNRVELITLIKKLKIQYKIEMMSLLFNNYDENYELENFLEFYEIFPEKI